MKNVQELSAIIANAKANPLPYRSSGCGRVYVGCSAGGIGREAVSPAEKKAIVALFKKAGIGAGLRWIPEMKKLYVGYDNNSGRELGQGEAIAAALNAAGIPAYMDCEGD